MFSRKRMCKAHVSARLDIFWLCFLPTFPWMTGRTLKYLGTNVKQKELMCKVYATARSDYYMSVLLRSWTDSKLLTTNVSFEFNIKLLIYFDDIGFWKLLNIVVTLMNQKPWWVRETSVKKHKLLVNFEYCRIQYTLSSISCMLELIERWWNKDVANDKWCSVILSIHRENGTFCL